MQPPVCSPALRTHPAFPGALGTSSTGGDEGKLSWRGISDFWEAGGDGFVGTEPELMGIAGT